jgi:hypothetical protein
MTKTRELIRRIENYCEQEGIAPGTFGRLAVNDGKLIRRLREGKSITLRTLDRIEAKLSERRSRSRRRRAA